MSKSKKIATFSMLLSATGFSLFFINKCIEKLSVRKDLLYSEHGEYYNWRLGRIFYTKQGEGTPLLLIHDLTHYSSDIEFKKIIQPLAKNHTVYTLDLPGCGRSDKANIAYTSYLYVQLLNDFIKHIIKAPTDVITSGFSSSIATMACYTETSLYKKLLFINPVPLNNLNKIPTSRRKIVKYLIDLPLIGTSCYFILSRYCKIEKALKTQFYNKAKIPGLFLSTCYESAHTNHSNAKYIYSSIASHYVNTNINHALRQLNNSIYIIMGEEESNSRETIAQYTEQNCAIESTLLPHSKHYPHLEIPEDFLEICDIFF